MNHAMRVMADPDVSAMVQAGEGDAGRRLDRVLAAHLFELSRTRLKRLIADGYVTLDGVIVRDPSLRVGYGQIFVVILPQIEEAAPAAQPLPLDIRFEDPQLIVIDKPAGMVVHPAPGNPDGTLVNALLAHCGAGRLAIAHGALAVAGAALAGLAAAGDDESGSARIGRGHREGEGVEGGLG